MFLVAALARCIKFLFLRAYPHRINMNKISGMTFLKMRPLDNLGILTQGINIGMHHQGSLGSLPGPSGAVLSPDELVMQFPNYCSVPIKSQCTAPLKG